MKSAFQTLISKRAIVLLLSAVLILSVLNTYLIFGGIQSANRTNVVNYDYVLSKDGDKYLLKNMLTGYVTQQLGGASGAINSAMHDGKSIYLNPGTYELNDDVAITNKLNAKLMSDGATINGNGKKIVIFGDNYTQSQFGKISGLTLINATVHVENSFALTITDTNFFNCTTAIEFANTHTWSEYNKIENCHFINVSEGIAFRTPARNGTGSYASSQIERCTFKLADNSIGINVEPLAEFSDSQIRDVRFWAGEIGHTNQTALRVYGSMFQTLLFGVVFESFASDPVDMYAIDLGQTCNPDPIMSGGVSFLGDGNWTAKVHTPYQTWVSAVGSIFDRENAAVQVGTNDQFGEPLSIQCRPLTIFSFKPKLDVSFSGEQTVTVRIRIEYIDNVISPDVTRTFTNSSQVWLSDDEILQLYPSQNVIWEILVDAKTTAASTDASVKVSGYGTAG